MQLVFVRHGSKQDLPGVEDAELPLTAEACALAARLREELERRGLVPRFILSSRYRHALETAELLRAKRTRAIIPVTALTQHTAEKDFSMATVVQDAWAAGVDLFEAGEVLMLVGHETRLSQLAGHVVGRRLAPLGLLEALVVEVNAADQARITVKE